MAMGRIDLSWGVTGVQEQLGMKNGVLFAAPMLDKYHSVGETIQTAIEIAAREAQVGTNKSSTS